MNENTREKIRDLVDTRINGNSIKGNKTYEGMLNNITKLQIKAYALEYDLKIWGYKLEMIEQIKDSLTRRGN